MLLRTSPIGSDSCELLNSRWPPGSRWRVPSLWPQEQPLEDGASSEQWDITLSECKRSTAASPRAPPPRSSKWPRTGSFHSPPPMSSVVLSWVLGQLNGSTQLNGALQAEWFGPGCLLSRSVPGLPIASSASSTSLEWHNDNLFCFMIAAAESLFFPQKFCVLNPPISGKDPIPMFSLQKLMGKDDKFFRLMEACADEARS